MNKIIGKIEISEYAPVTVADLIKTLNQHPQSSRVCLKLDRDYYGYIDGSYIQIEECE